MLKRFFNSHLATPIMRRIFQWQLGAALGETKYVLYLLIIPGSFAVAGLLVALLIWDGFWAGLAGVLVGSICGSRVYAAILTEMERRTEG